MTVPGTGDSPRVLAARLVLVGLLAILAFVAACRPEAEAKPMPVGLLVEPAGWRAIVPVCEGDGIGGFNLATGPGDNTGVETRWADAPPMNRRNVELDVNPATLTNLEFSPGEVQVIGEPEYLTTPWGLLAFVSTGRGFAEFDAPTSPPSAGQWWFVGRGREEVRPSNEVEVNRYLEDWCRS